MKKFFKGVIDLILRHKLLTIVCITALIVLVVLVSLCFNMFIGSGNKYGSRLDGIDDVTISSKLKKSVVSTLKEKEEVSDASLRIQGKIIYINITFTRETALDKAKEIANETLTLFDEDEKEFYDFGYFLTQVEVTDSEDVGYIVTGTKSTKSEVISWIKS